MKDFVLLRSARNDLVWFLLYYQRVFPDGGRAASEHYAAALDTICEQPHIGRRAFEDVRRFPIRKTPFVILYRVRERIEVLRVRDQRAVRERQ